MKQICELNDRIILGTDGMSTKAPRITARAIVKNQDGLYAVMYADKFKLHSLPGGGVEDGEDVLFCLYVSAALPYLSGPVVLFFYA